jgi:D-alanyl-lipoteichoic acid acyltransferase DltB (MBOAT superfamily)
MLFVSQVFIFVFLPISVIGFYAMRRTLGNGAALAWLFAASLFFYGYSYPPYVLLILASYTINFLGARRLQQTGSRPLLILMIALNLGYLGYFKYCNFFVDNLNSMLGLHMPNGHIALPLGISFYTFQQIPYLVGAYQRQFHNVGFLKYCVVNSFFPHLIAGPIIWHREIAPQLERAASERFNAADFARGVTFFGVGLFKKVIIADNLAYLVDDIFGAVESGKKLTFGDSWLGAIAYGLQIYFDFSGYSEMAIGLALMFGIRFPINFFSPYKATSIIEFWRRWHMTMTRFFQEYVYVPLQFAVGRRSEWAGFRYLIIFVMMFLVGLWHGAGWTWVAWGSAHGLLLVINHLWRAGRSWLGVPYHAERSWLVGRMLGWTLTFFVVMACWVVFRAKDFTHAHVFYQAMFLTGGASLPESVVGLIGLDASRFLGRLGVSYEGGWLSAFISTKYAENQLASVFGLIGFVALMPNTIQLMGYFTSVRNTQAFRTRADALLDWGNVPSWRPNWVWIAFTSLFFAVPLTSILDESAKTVFIYFNF